METSPISRDYFSRLIGSEQAVTDSEVFEQIVGSAAFLSKQILGVHKSGIRSAGDGKATLLSKDGAFQKMEQLKKKTSFMWFLRKLKQYEPEFKVTDFAADAHDIYVKAHAALADADKEKLHALVSLDRTEKFPVTFELSTSRVEEFVWLLEFSRRSS